MPSTPERDMRTLAGSRTDIEKGFPAIATESRNINSNVIRSVSNLGMASSNRHKSSLDEINPLRSIVSLPELVTQERPATITICGGGNSVHVLAALLGEHPNFNVQIWDIMHEESEILKNKLSKNNQFITVTHKDGKPPSTGKVALVSTQASDVVPQSDMIILAVPAFAHDTYLQAAAPFLHDNMHIGAMVAQGGFDFAALDALKQSPNTPKKLSIFACETLPWACRISDYGHTAEILGTKEDVDITIAPQFGGQEIASMLEKLVGKERRDLSGNITDSKFPRLHPMSNFLTNTLMNINSVWHPCICYGRFGPDVWDQQTPFSEVPLFYEGVDERTADTLIRVSNEVLLIKDRLIQAKPDLDLSGVTHVFDWILRSYPGDIQDNSSLQAAITSNKAYKGLKHTMKELPELPGKYLPDTHYRYFSEDLPFGLVVTRGIAELANVPTPYMDKVITWAQELMGKEYLVDGQLRGNDVGFTRAPQRYGITDLKQLLDQV
jgi:hypothetical protein